MSQKTVVLAVIAVILAFLTIYDYSAQGEDEPATEMNTSQSARLERFAGLVHSEKKILTVYGDAAIPYAQQMATAKTFFFDKFAPKRVAKQLINQLVVEQDAKVESISVGEPHLRGDGVFSLSASVKITAFNHRSAFRVLSSLADFNSGLTWRSFSLKGSVDDKQIVILGDLMLVLVQAVE